ncbi:DUF4274 domain-containing protein [Mesorhizobium sp. LjRoot246]|uniref:DUF4274 domain-containing protein n=1 Tax=Mesorhizobium sp. LjRoot246 TaxID=3342294 RepID=UPI003ECD88E8
MLSNAPTARDALTVQIEMHAVLSHGHTKLFATLDWRRLLGAFARELNMSVDSSAAANTFITALRLGSDMAAVRLKALSDLYFHLDALTEPEVAERIACQPAEIQAKLPTWLKEMQDERNTRAAIQTAWESEDKLMAIWLSAKSARVDIPGKNLVNWLAQQTPDTWHAVLSNWNYDFGIQPLRWVVWQPQCDQATAADIFFADALNWVGYPTLESVPRAYRKAWLLCKAIARNWSRGRYKSAELNSRHDLETVKRYQRAVASIVADGGRLPFKMPDEACRIFEGRRSVSHYTSMDGEILYSFDAWKERNRE